MASTWADDSSDSINYQAEYDDRAAIIRHNQGPSSYQSTQETLRDHEAGLERLGAAIKRQHLMAGELATEVDQHNEILDNIDTGITNTSENLRKNTRNLKLIRKEHSTLFLWCIVVILAAIIIGLAIL